MSPDRTELMIKAKTRDNAYHGERVKKRVADGQSPIFMSLDYILGFVSMIFLYIMQKTSFFP